ncbi:MAG: glycosyltransferase [Anaerolineae bacterium]|nr:glycosyltransferase [Anaerolineae bacterium]
MDTGKKHHMLLVTIGSAGDVYPFLALGAQLKRRGHQVTLVTSLYFEEIVKQEGLDFIPVGTREDYLKIVQNPDLWDPQQSLKFYGTVVLGQLIRPIYHIITDYMEKHKNALLIAQATVFAAQTAHEKHGYPFVTLHLQPAAFRTVYDFPLLPAWLPRPIKRAIFHALDKFVLDPALTPSLNEFRAELGLEPVKKLMDKWIHSPQKTIGLFNDWFAQIQPDWPPQTELTGFVLYDPNQDAQLPEEVQEFLDAGESPIVFTPGTSFQHGADFFTASVEACQVLNKRGLLLTRHRAQIPKNLPSSVRHVEYVPFGTLLPYTAALVHHGGVGTLAQALKAGVPQLIRPVAQDQPDSAVRLEQLGVAARLAPNHYTGKNVAEKLDYLLTSSRVREACLLAKASIDSDQALLRTCQAIENMANGSSSKAIERVCAVEWSLPKP